MYRKIEVLSGANKKYKQIKEPNGGREEMAATDRGEPVAEQMLNNEDARVKPWAGVREIFDAGGTYWLATVRKDGRPHVVPIGPAWMDDKVYFTTGQGTRKEKNLAHNPHCVITLAGRDFDVVVEGTVAKVTDSAKLDRLAAIYRANGWPATVADGALDAPFSAPTTGPAPYNVYEVTPSIAFAFGTEEETVNHSTRYRF